MPTFKQKNVIKSYKLRLQEKLKTVSEETENATSFLNNCVLEFKNRVQHILEIKDEKCLSLYRKLIRDLENYSEKLFILQASIEEVTEEESDSSEDEEVISKLPKDHPKSVPDFPSQNESLSVVPSYAEDDVNLKFSFHDEDGGSFTEDDFCSLHSDNTQNANSTTLLSSQIEEYNNVSGNRFDPNITASHSSCYRSISSSISESLSFQVDSKVIQSVETLDTNSKYSLETPRTTFVIHPTVVEISSQFSATLSCIIDPGNFWIQIENSHGSNLSFPKSEYDDLSKLSFIKEGSYCLAPFKSTSFYYRAQSLSCGKSRTESIRVLFIDHGTTQDVYLCDLRSLPVEAYAISAQAIHCFLHGIKPENGSWSKECIDRFKNFQNCCIETLVKSKGELYGVQLVAKLNANICEDFSVDIAEALCSDRLAVSINESSMQNVTGNQQCESQLSKPVCNKTESCLEVSGSYDINAISSDSGVSVTSAYKSSQIPIKRNQIFNKVRGDYISSAAVENTSISPYNTNLLGFNHDTRMKDLISFGSCDALEDLQNSNGDKKLTNRSFTSSCLVCRRKDFCLHLKIPSPSLLFVQKDMVIVMLSHIINPFEFYVNMAMKNIVTFDDLQEQMTSTYESDESCHPVKISDLSENMFCAGRYDADGLWYRFKILRISQEDREKDQVFGQFVDYGNFTTIKCCDLQPLTPQFSHHPIFAIKCSLAGVAPIDNVSSHEWNEAAINVFKKLTLPERCLTAQICNEFCSDQTDAYSVLLWDTEDSHDLLINSALADQEVAVFDYTLLHKIIPNQKVPNSCVDIDSWVPMVEEYYDTENSYAIDDEELEILTTGYQAQDEKYICKYFSLWGHCPQGDNCNYEHLPLLESGVTRDQEEVYCVDSVPIISETASNILVKVSAIVTPGYFYVILPFGCKTVDEIDELVYKGNPYNQIINSEAKALFHAIDKHYSKSPFQENTKIALSCGTIVVAKRKWDEKWHRGRIIEVVGINSPAKVFFVDSGDNEWVSRKFIRTILPQFLHTPFQAVRCGLHGIEPIGSAKGLSWSSEAMNYFKDIVAGEILLAETVHRFGQIFHVSLRKTSEIDHESVAHLLVSAGYAQYYKAIPSIDYKAIPSKSVFLPG